jgi:hypothetical protein
MQIESHSTAVGVPDTNTCHDGFENWVELKFTRDAKLFTVRPAQMTWFRRRARAGARNLWIGWKHDNHGEIAYGMIHMAGTRLDAVFNDMSPFFWRYASAATWTGEIRPDILNRLLKRGSTCP